jgi:signal peptidase II
MTTNPITDKPTLRYRIISLLLFVTVAVIGVTADLCSKNYIFNMLGMPGMYENDPEGVYWLVKGVVGFQTSLNEGAVFGVGQGRVTFLVVVSVIALVVVVVWLWNLQRRMLLTLSTILGMITAGIIGNLYDRLGLHNLKWNYNDPTQATQRIGEPVFAVRDWILVMIGNYHWPNFNIADSLLVCAAITLILFVMLTPDKQGKGKI